jgi:4-hydroxy-tetrahydrodipicolinate reductase
VAELKLVAFEGGNGEVNISAAKRHHEDGGDLEIRGTAHLAHRDGQAVEVGVMHIGLVQHIGQGATDEFADTQLALGGTLGGEVFCHGAHVAALRAGGKGVDAKESRGTQMGDLPGIVVTGASGRMGQMLIRIIGASDRARLHACVERAGHDWIGQDAGVAMGGSALGVTVTDDPVEAFARAQAVVDFTTPAATVDFAGLAAQARAVHVIGTTGLEAGHLAAIGRAAHHTVIVRAGNMSLGVNLLVRLTEKVAAALDADWDVEIVEAHHRMKVDAPSGTALMLGQAAALGRGGDLADLRDPVRDGVTGARRRGGIGFAAVRGGDVVGEHDVIFAGEGERIVLRHLATDRSIFARGALKAALWGVGRKPGEYDMMDVLGL